MNINDIKKVVILGAGTMGQQISIPCALGGYDVVIYDISEDALQKALKGIPEIMAAMIANKRLTQSEADALIKRITTTSNPEVAAKDADLINESVPEVPELKVKVFSQFNKLCPERTIFTTNTSSLLPSKFADATGRPEKFLSLHYHDTTVTDVVDIMPHPGTSKEIIEIVRQFAVKTGQIPIMMKKENSGYVFNYMMGAVYTTALSLVSRNVVSVEDVDRAWMGVTHMPYGPFGIMDNIGLDTMYHVTEFWAEKTQEPRQLQNAVYLKKYIEAGTLGRKVKKGFYTYPNPAYEHPDFLKQAK